MIRPTVVLAFALLLLAPAAALRAHDNYRIIGTVAQVTTKTRSTSSRPRTARSSG